MKQNIKPNSFQPVSFTLQLSTSSFLKKRKQKICLLLGRQFHYSDLIKMNSFFCVKVIELNSFSFKGSIFTLKLKANPSIILSFQAFLIYVKKKNTRTAVSPSLLSLFFIRRTGYKQWKFFSAFATIIKTVV